MRIIVLHARYGCDTGCCGHVVEVDGKETGGFQFAHPWGADHAEFVRDLVTKACGEEHVKDIDWLNTIVVDD